MMSKDELYKIPTLAEEVDREADRINAMRGRLTSPKGFDDREKVQTSAAKQNALVDVIIDMEQQLEQKRAELDRLCGEARTIIDTAEGLDDDEYFIIRLRYVQVFSWETVEQMMHVSRATVFRKHNSAIDKIFGAGEKLRPNET